MTATYAELSQQVYDAFSAAWGSTTPFCLDNESFKPTDGTSWVRCVVRHLAARQDSLGPVGSRRFDRDATCIVQVFAPLDTGPAAAYGLAQTVKETFEGGRILASDVRFHATQVREVGPTKDGWYQINVDTPFTYTETR